MHLLNVPAIGMSAFPEMPRHFLDWLAEYNVFRPVEGWQPSSFAPRRIYRDYLKSLVEPYLAIGGRLQVHRNLVLDIVEHPDCLEIVTESGAFEFSAGVLATGNEPAPTVQSSRVLHSWSCNSEFTIPKTEPVIIAGTGLSMIDTVISLLNAGHSGSIRAISRRGLLPQPHGSSRAMSYEPAEIPDENLSSICRWLRRQASLGDWRGASDALRPHTQWLWQRLSITEKQRFLRHGRPWWDIHRHRMAPQIHDRITAAMSSGQLEIVPANIIHISQTDHGVEVCIRPRGKTSLQTCIAHSLIDCRGQSRDVHRTANPLLRNLLESGAARPDELGLGIDVANSGAVVDAHGRHSARLFALGPVTIGTFWESVAIPDIRMQARDIAAVVTHHLAETPGTMPCGSCESSL